MYMHTYITDYLLASISHDIIDMCMSSNDHTVRLHVCLQLFVTGLTDTETTITKLPNIKEVVITEMDSFLLF